MQPKNSPPMPISAFLFDFPVEMRSVEDPSRQSRQAPVKTGVGAVEDPGFDFHAYANRNLNMDVASSQAGHPVPSQNADQIGVLRTGDAQTVGLADNYYTGYAPACATIQDTIYTLGSTPYPTGTDYENTTIENASTAIHPNPVQNHLPAVPTTSEVYRQQGPADLSNPSGHGQHSYHVQDDTSLPSGMAAGQQPGPSAPNLSQEHYHGLGVSASVVVTGLPAFNIPIDVAILLSNMYRH